jgi:hypothetical protein
MLLETPDTGVSGSSSATVFSSRQDQELILLRVSKIAHSLSVSNFEVSEASNSRRIARTLAEKNGGHLHLLRSRGQGLRASLG